MSPPMLWATICTRVPYRVSRVGRWRGSSRSFSIGPPPNRTCTFQRIRLSRDNVRLGFLHAGAAGPPCVDVVVAFGADDQRLSSYGDHALLPLWKFASSFGLQIG